MRIYTLIGVGLFLFFSGILVYQLRNAFVENRSVVEDSPFIDEVERFSLSPSLPTPSPTPQLSPIPNSKILAGSNHVFQTFNNCGPASLSMTLSLYGISVSQQTLGAKLRPYQNAAGNNDDKSVTLAEIAQIAKEYGFVPYLRPTGDIRLVQQFIAQDMPVITRTWLKQNEDIGHFRVIKGYDISRQILIQDDSLQGKDLEYSYAEYDELWKAFNYEFLVLVPTEKVAVAEHILGNRLDEIATWKQALLLAQEAVEQNPEDVFAKFNQVTALYHLGEYQQAVEIYERIATSLPKRMLWYQLEPILAYYKLGRFDDVLRISQQIFDSQNRAYSELHWLSAEIFQQRGNTELSNNEFQLAKTYNASSYWKVNLN